MEIVHENENSRITQFYTFSESLSFLVSKVEMVLSTFCITLDFCED